jgi:hypothetical protein
VTCHLWHQGAGCVSNPRDRQRSREGHIGTLGWVVVTRQQNQAAQLTQASDGERKGDKRAPGVADDHGPLDIEALQHAMYKMRLG